MSDPVVDLTGMNRTVDQLIEEAEHLREKEKTPYGGGGGGDGMDYKIAHLEGRFDGMEKRFDRLEARLDRIEDKIPSQWELARTMAAVLAFFMLVAVFGPRIAAMIPLTP